MTAGIDANRLEELLSEIEKRIPSGAGFHDIINDASTFLPRAVVKGLEEALVNLSTPVRKDGGRFLVFTGIDRSGKETQAFNPRRLAGVKSAKRFLTEKGYRVLSISLPSYGTPMGALVAAHLGRPGAVTMKGRVSKEHAWLLWSLDRAQHSGKVSLWLEKDKRNLVLARRWLESNVVYQKAQGIDPDRILRLERNIVRQSHTVVFDIPTEESVRRAGGSEEPADLYEEEEFMQRVRRFYLSLPAVYPFGEFYLLDGGRSPPEVNRDVLRLLDEMKL